MGIVSYLFSNGGDLWWAFETLVLQPEPNSQQQHDRAADNFHCLLIRRLHPDDDEEEAAERGDDGERAVEPSDLPRAVALPLLRPQFALTIVTITLTGEG